MENKILMSPEESFLRQLFNYLKKENVQYCVLRNFKSLPFTLDGSDLDFLVAEEDLDKITNAILDIACKNNGFGIRIVCGKS